MRILQNDIGKFFIDKQGDVWKCISRCEQPTATLERVKDGLRDHGTTDCPNFQKYQRLTPLFEGKE